MQYAKQLPVVLVRVLGVVVAVTKRFRNAFFLLLLFLFIQSQAVAKTKMQLVNNVMMQSGSDGKQVADGSGNEDLTIFEPVFYVDSQLTPKTHIFGSLTADVWSSASEAIFDTTTGASGKAVAAGNSAHIDKESEQEDEREDDENEDDDSSGSHRKLEKRLGLDLGVSQKVGTFTFTPRLGYSSEFDYRSINGGLSIAKSFAEDNFVLAAGYQLFWDKTHPFDAANAQFLDWQNKRTQSFDLSVSQILSPSDLILVGYNFTMQNGYLAGSRNTVELAGKRLNEVLPDSRLRHAATMRYVHGFNDFLALHLDYRYYFDNWGFRAHTAEPSLAIGFHEDDGLVKLFYRYYQQNASTYYKDNFSANKTYMTADSDLAAFHANEAGALVSYSWDLGAVLKSINASAGASYYMRSNHLNVSLFQLGIGGTF